jgi:hypothetical protein
MRKPAAASPAPETSKEICRKTRSQERLRSFPSGKSRMAAMTLRLPMRRLVKKTARKVMRSPAAVATTSEAGST